MNINEFQTWIGEFYKQRGWTKYGPFIRMGFLAEETGELARAVRAIEIGRDRPDETEKAEGEQRRELIEELGDVLGNIILLANLYDLTLEEVMEVHKEKLLKRFQDNE
ncbi:hypothetical protein AM501_06515 [Aneurinibacillus migulanus]|uniref:NTP pyrophosphatase, house-cleaning of non-canonical NTPs n=1 Tax=Aneurinibacillus migulanus TaxID=47500 RepID=A0A0D1XC41_ANEMI|nr:MazG-like family protein [Aneurinibacillus migulanus]KIV49903.1 hypothetical protein TS64_29330 [Aneurinibacillus migulanus]KIV58867.1 hypothetical protein TS65_05850 [Aneurinibacillus migulanus]KON96559.1 hypothetical protein AF333_14840 [Aneurinibacillus migulanus]KPD09052.1 hypothetical protein AM501_06515 [Aneurinibacillus migulanus]MCP1358391.1 MazG-like family protein [Aneurinibacillus migulanus]